MQDGLPGNDDFQSALSERSAGQSAAALARISKLLELQPGHVDGWWLRAACELDLGRRQDAIDSLQNLLELDPGHGSALGTSSHSEFSRRCRQCGLVYGYGSDGVVVR